MGDGRTALTSAEIDATLVPTAADVPTGTAWTTVAGRDNTIVVVAGANGSRPPDWPDDPAQAALGAADVVLPT